MAALAVSSAAAAHAQEEAAACTRDLALARRAAVEAAKAVRWAEAEIDADRSRLLLKPPRFCLFVFMIIFYFNVFGRL